MFNTHRTSNYTSSQACRVLATSLVLALLVALTAVSAFGGAVQTVLYQASAFGTSAFVGSTIIVGQTGVASLQEPCGTNNDNEIVDGSGVALNLFPIVTGGAVTTTASSSPSMTAQAAASTANVSLLGGLITAQALNAVSTTTLTSSGFQVSAAGSTFTNLLIAGIPYNSPAPNTMINLLGLGYVVLNEQTSAITSKQGQMTVNMIDIHITVANNLLGLDVGTEIIVSNATSGMIKAFAPAIVTGSSFGTSVASTLISSSPTAPVNLPCFGTAGQLLTNSVASVNIAGVLSSGAVTDTGESDLTNPLSKGQMTSQVEGLNLLNGLITANVIFSQVNAVVNGFGGTFETGVGSFTGLSVAGYPAINDDVPYNTQVSILGLGTLYLKHLISNFPYPDTTEVRMIELVINQSNSYNLPIGADIIISDAQITMIPAAMP
ncbi:MAG: choice-of-anchor P family protein [Candidatus Korobacteraceae bacterium]